MLQCGPTTVCRWCCRMSHNQGTVPQPHHSHTASYVMVADVSAYTIQAMTVTTDLPLCTWVCTKLSAKYHLSSHEHRTLASSALQSSDDLTSTINNCAFTGQCRWNSLPDEILLSPFKCSFELIFSLIAFKDHTSESRAQQCPWCELPLLTTHK